MRILIQKYVLFITIFVIIGMVDSRIAAQNNQISIEYGTTISDSISYLGEIDEYKFEGKRGERIILRLDPEGINTEFRGKLELYSPSDTLLVSKYDDGTYTFGYYGGRQVSIEDYVLPEDGDYTIYVREDDGDHTSNYWLSLHSREYSRDHAATISYDTTLTSEAIDPYGDIDAYRFEGKTGERIILRLDPEGINTEFRGKLELYSPSDTLLVSKYDDGTYTFGYYGGRQVSIEDYVLPEDGNYTIYVREDDGDHTSNYWLSLHSREYSRDHAATISYDTTLTSEAIDPYGDIDAYRFEGKTGERIILRLDPEGINTEFRGKLELYSPSDTLLVSKYDDGTYTFGYYGGRQVSIEDYVLPEDGNYTIYVREDDGDHTSNYWLSLHSREYSRDHAATISYDTTLTSEAIDPYGDIDAYRFEGKTGERIILRLDPEGINTEFRGKLELYSPSDTLLVSKYDDGTYTFGYYGGRQVSIEDYVLPEDGDYTIYVREDDGDHTSNYWLSLHSREYSRDHAATISYDTTLTSEAIDPYGDIDAYRFEGKTGERIILRLDPEGINTEFRGKLELYSPSDTLLVSKYDDGTYTFGYYGGRQVSIEDYVLPEDGDYTIYVREDDGDHTSNYWLSLHSREYSRDHAATISYDTTLTSEAIDPYGDIDAYRFEGKTGERIILRLDPEGINTEFRGKLELYSPSDTLLVSKYDDGTYTFGYYGGRQVSIEDYVLPEDGNYTIYVREDDGDHTSNYWLSLHSREYSRDHAATISYDTTLTSEAIDPYGDIDAYRFEGKTGERIILRLDPEGINTEFRGKLELYSPSDTLLVSKYDDGTYTFGYYGGRQVSIEDYVLPEDGNYTIYVREDDGDHTSNYWLSLHSREYSRDHAATISYDTTLTSEAIDPYGDIDAYQFEGKTGERIILRLEPEGINTEFRGKLELYSPSDTLLVSKYDDGTYTFGYYGGRQVSIEDYVLPEDGNYTIYVREDDGDHTSNYWLSLQVVKLLELELALSNQKFIQNLDNNYYEFISKKSGIITFVISKNNSWDSKLSIKKSNLANNNFFSTSADDNLSVLCEANDTIYINMESTVNDVIYSILATEEITRINNLLVIDNEIVQSKIDIKRAAIEKLIYKKESNAQLLSSYLFDFGSDPELGQFLNKNWTIKNAEVYNNYINVSLQHSSGFENEIEYSWLDDKIEINCDITAPEPVELINTIMPGGSWDSGRDHWAFPSEDGTKIGEYPNEYPADQSWSSTTEGWIALWDDQISEVCGFTFSGGYQIRLNNRQEFMVPAGNSRISFHVLKTQSSSPYEVIKDLATGPYLVISNVPDKLFVGVGNEVSYTNVFKNTGNSKATDIIIETELDGSIQINDGTITDDGIYNPQTNKITWTKELLDSNSQAETVAFAAQVQGGIINGTEIVTTTSIWATEQSVATKASSKIRVASPIINRIDPESGGNTGIVTVNIWGEFLDPNCRVSLTKNDQTIYAESVEGLASGSQVQARFDLIDIVIGTWELIVENPNGSKASYEFFKIEAGNEPQLILDIIGKSNFRIGRNTPITIKCKNNGNVNLYDVLLAIKLPPNTNIQITNSEVITTENYIDNEPVGFNNGDEVMFPIWLYELPSKSEKEISFYFKPIGDLWGAHDPVDIEVDVITNDSHFAQKGDFSYIETSPVYRSFRDIIYKSLKSENIGVSEEFVGEALYNELILWTYDLGWATYWTLAGGVVGSVAALVGGAPAILLGFTVNAVAAYNWWEFYKNYKKLLGIAVSGLLRGQIILPNDPNEKVSSAGYDKSEIEPEQLQHYVVNKTSINYFIFFENVDSATAPAQEIMITDELSDSLDWSTFSFDKIQIGLKNTIAPGNLKSFATTVDMRPDLQCIVEVNCQFDQATGQILWLLKGVDPYTGDYADMLLPNTQEVAPKGEGWVSFSIKPREELKTGTIIRNKAVIDFEKDIPPAPIETNEVFNTIDSDIPESHINLINQFPDSSLLEVKWKGIDVGSGVVNYTIYVSKDKEPFAAWLKNTPDTSAYFEPETGNHNYRFYSIAHDGVGNVEALPDSFDIELDVVTSVENTQELPKTFRLYQNYPNPFNPTTSIQFEIPNQEKVTIKIYDILGREVYTLADKIYDAGTYKEYWDGNNNFNYKVGSGIYFIRFQASNFIKVRKMILLK